MMKKKTLNIKIQGEKPVKGVDYFTPEEQEFFVKTALSLIEVPKVDYKKVEKFIKKEISQIPVPVVKEQEPIDYNSIILSVLSQIPTVEPVVVDYDEVQKFIDKKIKDLNIEERLHLARLTNSAGPRTRLGELVDVNAEGLQNGQVLSWNGSQWVPTTVSGGSSTFLELTDTPSSYTGQGGKGVRVKGAEDGLEFYTTTDSDEKVKVSANDTTAGYLNGKLVESSEIAITENNNGGDETLSLSLKAGSIDETKLDTSVNASLDLADTALQSETDTLDSVTGRGSSTTNSITVGDVSSSNQTASRIAGFDASKKLVSLDTTTYPTLTELSYVKGVTSAIQTQLDGKVDENAPITGATKTKITYDSKGLVTAGADATTADIADSTNRRYLTDAQQTIVANTTASFTTTDETKLDYITVTQAVDLDQMETDIAALANGMVYKGDWDASAGTFPGSGSAQTGWFYYVSVAGTVDGVSFAIGDNIVATVDNASSTTYTGNWSKHDQTDAVSSVNGNVGAVVLDADDIAETASRIWFTTAEETKLAGIETGAEVNNISDVNATDLTDGGDSTLHYHSSDRNRANHTGTQTASTISDFDTEVSNNTDVAANTAARHAALTVTDSSEIDFTLTGQDLTASLKAGSIDESKLDASVNASLDLADTSLQPANISDTAYDSTSWNGVTTIAPSKNAVRDKIDAMDTTISGKQDTLVSGTNIKTINSNSLLGSGDLSIPALTDGDKGDITVSASGATWTVDNDAITYAKIQDVSTTDRILGRDTAGAGDIEELTVSGGLEFTGTGIRRSALTGEVTASAGSNSTTVDVTAITNKLSLSVPGLSDQMLIETGGALKKISLTNLFSIFGQIPIGGVIDWAGTTLPTGYLYCDGSVISRTTYADLFTAIGTTYGAGDGSTTFALPDARGRVTAGMDNMNNVAGTGGGDAGRLTSTSKAGVDGDTLGASGGVEEHLLLDEESGVPAHSHNYLDYYHVNDNVFANGTVNRQRTLTNANRVTSDNTPEDADEAHTNVQPTLVLNKIIRFGI